MLFPAHSKFSININWYYHFCFNLCFALYQAKQLRTIRVKVLNQMSHFGHIGLQSFQASEDVWCFAALGLDAQGLWKAVLQSYPPAEWGSREGHSTLSCTEEIKLTWALQMQPSPKFKHFKSRQALEFKQKSLQLFFFSWHKLIFFWKKGSITKSKEKETLKMDRSPTSPQSSRLVVSTPHPM